ncbi:hypothetical protein G4G28_14715 [Massilia sp. Dwa41.01b]|uniref:hypothetical protein n=1 Tax=unclassified Massilia TaxID=2609279 RepID=UPI0015FEC1F2|nr:MULTISPECIES: hypothetical protein [unclassified Massilia]QNA89413.1 hypothetical protein G4G28_14715 [Massilia sp. Dwa41.01b]QNB00313.1 hypothetical protein G4G31_18295 [Massilia sp. Se16.2.3]
MAILFLSTASSAHAATFVLGESCQNEGELTGSVSVIEWKGNIEITGTVKGKKVTAIVPPGAMQDYDLNSLLYEFRYNMKDGYTSAVELECSEGNVVDDWTLIYTPKEQGK